MARCSTVFVLYLLLGGSSTLRGDELLPTDRPIPEAIDHYVDAALQEQSISPAPAAGDEGLIRRLTLDLAGRIPTVQEVRDYVASTDADKRVRLADRLLGSPDFVLHHTAELETMLLPGERRDKEFREYLLAAVRENRPWDRMFREMMFPGEATAGAVGFLKPRVKRLDDLTNDVSRVFFGVSINCAQCHDHPLVEDWKQDHYFGFQTFFSRTYLTKKETLAEKSYGEVKFKTTAGEEKQAALMFLTSATVEEPKAERTKEERKAEDEAVKRQMQDKDAPPPEPPAFSPRSQFVELALRPENRHFFSRNIANRVWARLLGYGLVHPLDQMHSGNAASHEELLAWLTRDLEANGFDLKRLIRGVVLSDAYARSSRWPGPGEIPHESAFAVAVPRPLTPRQYALSLVVASKNPEEFTREWTSDEWGKRREQLENEANGYANAFEQPTEHFQVSVDEALFFSNNDRVQNDLLRDSGDRLVGRLKTLPDRAHQIAVAFRATLSREPMPEETAAFEEYLKAREDRLTEGLRQVVWALMTSPELRFNY